MRRLIAVIAIMAMTLPVSAEEDALILDMRTEDNGQFQVVDSHSGLTDGTIRAAVVGHFLWLEWGDADREYNPLSPNTVSVDVSDTTITRVVAHVDGTVDIVREAPETEEAIQPETVDLTEEYPEIDWLRLIPFGAYLK